MDVLSTFSLGGRVALVTGGSGGLGRIAARALAGAGAAVVVAGRDEARLAASVEVVTAAGGQAVAVDGDLTTKEGADAAVKTALTQFGQLDVLVATVGGGAGTALYPAEDYPLSEWQRILDLNLTSAVVAAQAAARAMIARGAGGRIVHVSSVRGQLGIPAGYSAYVAAKGALNALTRQQATEWAPHAVTVNAVAPTFVRTEQVADMLADEQFRAGLEARIPLRRIAEPEDLAGALLFLSSDASSFVTGQVLGIDGGLTATQ